MPTIGCTPSLASLSENSRAPKRLFEIGYRERRHGIRNGKLGELGDTHRPFAQRIGTVYMEMHEARTVAELVNVFVAVLIGVRARDHCFAFRVDQPEH